MNKDSRSFYEEHKNFSDRRLTEYFLSPGIRCKFDLLKKHIKNQMSFNNGIDLGCSGNSFLYFTDQVHRKCFLDIASKPLKQYSSNMLWHPLCGDLTRLPYRNRSFEFISALDVLEHISNDLSAISEINRILKIHGIVLITVPHRMKYFTKQDDLIGHYRRYEFDQILEMFKKRGLKVLKVFGVYGQLMRIENIQSRDPEKLEESLTNLRKKFESNLFFQKVWRVFVWITAKIMRIDVKHQSFDKVMNIGVLFQKES